MWKQNVYAEQVCTTYLHKETEETEQSTLSLHWELTTKTSTYDKILKCRY